MHELSIACALVEQVEELRRQHGAAEVLNITLTLGALAGVDQEALAFAFPIAAADTPLATAQLIIAPEPATVRCADCGKTTCPTLPALQCTECGSVAVTIVGGRDLIIKSVELVPAATT